MQNHFENGVVCGLLISVIYLLSLYIYTHIYQ